MGGNFAQAANFTQEDMEVFILSELKKEQKILTKENIEGRAQRDGRPYTQRLFTAALTELVDQDKIKRTKVGRVWWYSCLPDQTLPTKRAELAKLKAEVGQLKARYEALVRKLGLEQALNEGRDLDEVLNERIEAVDASLTEKLTKYGDLGDREELETMLQHMRTCREANRRNMQNLRILQSLYRDKLGVTPESLERQTGIPVNLEDME